MKELEKINPDALEVKTEVAIKKVLSVVPLKRHPGHTIWECNLQTGLVVPAEYKSEHVEFTGKIVKTLIAKDNCIYGSALNYKSAGKHFTKRLNRQLASDL